jgi:uncharacterized protein YcfJ
MNAKVASVPTALKVLLVGGLSVLSTQVLAATPPWAKAKPHAGREYDDARVVEVDPIVRRVRVEMPRRECWDEVRTEYPERYQTAGPTILGGIIGGVLGSQVGSGRGRDVATVAGTLIGASIGHDTARRTSRAPEEYTVERCQTRYENTYEERIEGYRVTYEYLGREYTTQLPYDPGDRIRVRVAVSPAEY